MQVFTGDGQVIKLQNLCFKFRLKKYHARTGRLKKKSCGAGAIKKISSSLKILQLPHQKSNGPPLILSCLQLCIDTRGMFIFLKRNPNLILAFDLRIFYFVSKSDCNIRLIVFQTTVKLCSKNK